MNFFYDAQLRKYLLQFVRMFGSFTVQKGFDNLGNPIYSQVPARYGDMSRQAGHILQQNSENTINAVPFISCYVANMEMAHDLRKYPHFEEKINIIEKKFSEETQTYSDEAGQSYTVTRHMPVPYKLTLTVDIWTSNTAQKLQILEQILVLFNPTINLHTNQNALDWTSLTYCELTNISWSGRSLPSGTDSVIDIATLTFQMPILINPPVKQQRMSIINTILTRISTITDDNLDNWSITDPNNEWSDYKVITLENYKLKFENNNALLLNKAGSDNGGDGSVLSWIDVLDNYGEVRPGISQLRLRYNDDITDPSSDVIGTINIDPINSQILNVEIDIDTLPANTLPAINAVIDPFTTGPGINGLPVAILGQRYLVLNDVPTGGVWGNITATENDIIEFNGSSWVLSFDSSSALAATEYATNLMSTEQFQWSNGVWQSSIEAIYSAGWWRIYL
jgi:hypothetical protein